MIFADSRAQAVYEAYEARNAAEAERVRAGVLSGLADRDALLLPVGAEVGQMLHALILARKPRRILELGTSYGYSTLFLADAARAVGGTVITMKIPTTSRPRHAARSRRPGCPIMSSSGSAMRSR